MKPNKTQVTISGILIVLALVLAVYLARRNPAPSAATEANKSASGSIRELVANPIKINAELMRQEKNLPPTCVDLWTRITEVTLDAFHAFTEEDKTAMKTCSDAVPILAKHDPAHIDKLHASCSTADEEGSNAMQNNCTFYFYLYKAGLVALFNQDKAVQDLGTEELALLIFHEYNNLDNRRLGRLSQLVDELLTRKPSYSTVKAKTSIQLFQLMNDPSPARAEELIRTLQDLRTQNADDEQLFEMYFVALAMTQDKAKMNELTDGYVRARPSSSVGYYIRSAYFWQEKNKDKAFDNLKQAIALDPANPRYNETRDKLEKAEPGTQGLYNVNVNFDLINE